VDVVGGGGAPTQISLNFVWRFAFKQGEALSIHDMWWCQNHESALQGPVLLDITKGKLYRTTTQLCFAPVDRDTKDHTHIMHVSHKDPFAIGTARTKIYRTTSPVQCSWKHRHNPPHIFTQHFKGLVSATAHTREGRLGHLMWKDCAAKVHQTILACIAPGPGGESPKTAHDQDDTTPTARPVKPFGDGFSTARVDIGTVSDLLQTQTRIVEQDGPSALQTDGIGEATKFRAMVTECFPAAVTNMMRIMTAALSLVCKIIEESYKGANDVLAGCIMLDKRQLAQDGGTSPRWFTGHIVLLSPYDCI
jgi:hypothetical protein